MSLAVSSGLNPSGMTTGSPPAASSAWMYGGKLRSLYALSYEQGTGIAMRGFTLHQSVVPAAPLSINTDFRLCQTGHQKRRQWLAFVRSHLRRPKVKLL